MELFRYLLGSEKIRIKKDVKNGTIWIKIGLPDWDDEMMDNKSHQFSTTGGDMHHLEEFVMDTLLDLLVSDLKSYEDDSSGE